MYVGALFAFGITARHLRLKRRRAIYPRIPSRFDAADTAACFDSIYKNVFTQHSDNRISFTDIRITKDQVSFLCDKPYAVVDSKKLPQYLFDPDFEDFDSCFVDPIGVNWYQVVGKNSD